MKKILSILLLVLLGFNSACSDPGYENDPNDYNILYSSAGITGSVVVNGEPVNAAAVLLTPNGGTSITGSDGLFSFTGLSSGTYELKVYKEGYLPFNKQVTVSNGVVENTALTISKNTGDLILNKGFIDMGSNISNNLAAFTITNTGDEEVEWSVTKGASWISKIEPSSGTLAAHSSVAVTLTIDRNKLSRDLKDNHSSIVVKSLTEGNGSTTELLVTVFGTGNGTNTANDNSDLDYVMVGDLYVQTKDVSDNNIDWSSAERLCLNSIVGGFNDWRLPTIDELATIYENRMSIGGFNDKAYYWSSSVSGNSPNTYAYVIKFSNGNTFSAANLAYDAVRMARAVRKNKQPELAQVTTAVADQLTETSAVLHGTIVYDGFPAYTERGFVYSTSHLPTVESGKLISYTNQSSKDFEETLNGLSLKTDYYFRAYVINEAGVAYGEEVKLRVETSSPIVTTMEVTDVTETSAVLHGKIEGLGIPAYTERGFVYSSTFAKPTLDDDEVKKVSGTTMGEFSCNLRGLITGKTYYVRAYAKNGLYVSYGETVSFKPESPDYYVLLNEGLMVQKKCLGSMFWTEADGVCKASAKGGYNDWRLPTLDELRMIYNNKSWLDFPLISYWSASGFNDKYNQRQYYYLNLKEGFTNYTMSNGYSLGVLAVRTIE